MQQRSLLPGTLWSMVSVLTPKPWGISVFHRNEWAFDKNVDPVNIANIATR